MQIENLSSKIESVTVYHRGALVKRRAELKATDQGSPSQLKVLNLPICLEDQSVGARVSGGQSLVVKGVQVILDLPGPQDDLAPQKPEELRSARLQEQILKRRISLLEASMDGLDRLDIPPRPDPEEGKEPHPFHLEARLKLSAFRSQRMEALAARRRELKTSLRELTKHRKDLEAKDKRATTSRQPQDHELRKGLLITLEGKISKDQPTELFFEYRVPDARWAPSYAARVASDLTSTGLEMRALVCQETGEDWRGVEIQLSTANPQLWVELAELKSRRIGRVQAEPTKVGWRPPPEGTEDLFNDFDLGFDLDITPKATGKGILQTDAGQPGERIEIEGDEEEPLMDHLAYGSAPPGGEVLQDWRKEDDAPARASMMMMAPAEMNLKAKFAPQPEQFERSRKALGQVAGPAATAPDKGSVARELAVQPSDEMLDYGLLRMTTPDKPERGQLQLLSRSDVYLEILQWQKITVIETIAHVIMNVREEKWKAPTLPAGYHYPAVQSNFDYSYSTQTPVDIPSNGQFHHIPVSVSQADSRLLLITVPRVDQKVYRTLKLRNPVEAPLPKGPVDVYLDGQYLLTSPLKDVPGGGDIELGLGVEQGIRISRNVGFEEDDGGIMPGKQNLRHEIQIEVTSHLGHGAEIEIRERLPVKEKDDKKVDVKVGKVRPRWEEFEQLEAPVQGAYRWRCPINPGESKHFRIDYTIHISSKHEVKGGNRRDC